MSNQAPSIYKKQTPQIIRKMALVMGSIILISIFIAGIAAYYITTTDPQTHLMYDGFGRGLSETPFFIRMLFGQDRLWAGWLWFIGDMIIFWGGLGVGFSLVTFGSKE